MDIMLIVLGVGGTILVLTGMLIVVAIARGMDKAASVAPAGATLRPDRPRSLAHGSHGGHRHARRPRQNQTTRNETPAGQPRAKSGFAALAAHDPALSAVLKAVSNAKTRATPEAKKKKQAAAAIVMALLAALGGIINAFSDDDDDKDDRPSHIARDASDR